MNVLQEVAYTAKATATGGREGIATMLMAVQVTTYKEYEPKPREDDFEMTDMKVVKVADNQKIDAEDMVDDDLDF